MVINFSLLFCSLEPIHFPPTHNPMETFAPHALGFLNLTDKIALREFNADVWLRDKGLKVAGLLLPTLEGLPCQRGVRPTPWSQEQVTVQSNTSERLSQEMCDLEVFSGSWRGLLKGLRG